MVKLTLNQVKSKFLAHWKTLLIYAIFFGVFILFESFGPQFRNILNESEKDSYSSPDNWIQWVSTLYEFLLLSSFVLTVSLVVVLLIVGVASVVVKAVKRLT